jgi:thiol-disulfide isomerase/thioredoxin
MNFLKNKIGVIMKYNRIIAVIAILIVSTFFGKGLNGNSDLSAAENKTATKVYQLVSADKPIGKKAGDFVWQNGAKQVKFSEFTKGKYVLLNFWGTWCPPCRRELPDLIAIAKEMENKGLLVVGVAMENSRTAEEAFKTVASFWESKQLYYPVVVGNGDLADAYGGITAVPSTFLINKKGEIVASFQGGRSKEQFMEEINKMMKK